MHECYQNSDSIHIFFVLFNHIRKEIGMHMRDKTGSECEAHYNRYYINYPEDPLPGNTLPEVYFPIKSYSYTFSRFSNRIY